MGLELKIMGSRVLCSTDSARQVPLLACFLTDLWSFIPIQSTNDKDKYYFNCNNPFVL